MAKVKVWNKNVHPLEETFKGDKIHIPANSWIEMEADDAVMYKGQFKPPMLDHDGNDLPEGFKMVVIEPMEGGKTVLSSLSSVEQDPLVCIACRFKAPDKDALASHMKSRHEEQAFSDPAIDKEIETKKKGKSKGVEPEEVSW